MQQLIGRYQILEEIAAGGQGTVYRAYDPDTRQIIALKVLHPTLSGDRTYIERFRREASLAASIDHPNVVKIFEVGQDGSQHFIALEFLPESLARVIESGPQMPIDAAAQFGLEVADGLAAAHALGIVHRDVKPQNVLIGQDGIAKVTDFGIARAESLATMTATGVMMGTPHYMSPEQSRGERADARSDVYSLGCMVYQMLAGEVPFKGDTPLAVIRQQIDEQPPRLRELRQDLPRRLEAVVERAMAKDPRRRYQSVAEMAQALRDSVPGLAEPASPPRRDTTPPPQPAAPRQRPTPPPRPAKPPEQAPQRPSASPTSGPANARQRSRRRRWAWAGGIFAALVLALVIANAALGGRNEASGVAESTGVAGGVPKATPLPTATMRPAPPPPLAIAPPSAPTQTPTHTPTPAPPLAIAPVLAPTLTPTPTATPVPPTALPRSRPTPTTTATPAHSPTPAPTTTPTPSPTPLISPAVTYRGGRFQSASITVNNRTVDVGSEVVVFVTLDATSPTTGELTIDVRKDVDVGFDQPMKTCSTEVSLLGGSNDMKGCEFVADEITGDEFNYYFFRVLWNGSVIHNAAFRYTRVHVADYEAVKLANSAWPMSRHDQQRTGRSEYVGPTSPEEKWRFAIGRPDFPPAIGPDGTIYIASDDGYTGRGFYAINPDGSVRWELAIPISSRNSPAISADGTIYAGKYAINSDGSVKWTFVDGGGESSPAIGDDGTIYSGSGNWLLPTNPDGSGGRGQFSMLNSSSPAVAPDGTLYVVTTNGLVAYDGSQEQWIFAANTTEKSSPAVATDGAIYLGTPDGLYAINPDGSQRWVLTTGEPINSSPAISGDGTIWVGSDDGRLYAVTKSGAIKGAITIGGMVRHSPVVDANGTVYIASDERKLYAINPEGTLKWVFDTDYPIASSPVIGSDGTLYLAVNVRINEGWLYAIGDATVATSLAPSSSPTPASTVTTRAMPTTTPAPVSGRIAFASDRDGNFEIYVMNADGTGQTRLTHNNDDDFDPAWSAGGAKIAFHSELDGLNTEIYVMNADGSGQTRLTNNPSTDKEPAWSPDSSKIAFQSTRVWNAGIYVMNADGTGHTRLTNNAGIDGSPAWSPDAGKITFKSFRDGVWAIYAMNADGSDEIRLTHGARYALFPAWSPDGAKIAFSSNRGGSALTTDIYVMNADGSGQTRLTNNPTSDREPAWSPDGAKIAFMSFRDGNFEIYVMNADGSGQTRLTNNPTTDGSPAWSPE